MRIRLAVSAVVVACLSPVLGSPARAQHDATVISGRVLGADGAPLKVGHVHLYPGRHYRREAHVPIAADGRFAIATTAAGPVSLTITGVDHYPVGVQLMIEGPTAIGLDVRLKHYAYTDSLERVTAIGDWNQFNFGTGRPLVRQSDGRYALEIETAADTLSYQLLGLEERGSRSINGTQADRYAYDGGGDYRSVIRAQGGRATIVFDPAMLVRRTGDVAVSFREPSTRVAQLYARLRDWNAQRTAFMDSSNAARQRHDSLRYEWSPIIAGRTAALARERDPLVHQLLLLQLWEAETFSRRLDPAVARRVVAEVPPTSPWWTMREFGGPSTLWLAVRIAAGRKAEGNWRSDTATAGATLAYLDRVIAEHPDSMVQAEALGSAVMVARIAGDAPRSNDYFLRLDRDYPDSPDIAFMRSRYSPTRVMQVGRQIPAFRFPSFDDSTVTYTRESMLGRTYLLEFWATWCGPCVGEMPYLHAAHDSLAADSVEFLAVSLDRRPEDVRTFRAGEWKMPWLHAFAVGEFGSREIQRLEILAVPTSLLIGPDGKILVVDVRGERIVSAVREALRSARAP